MGGSSGKGTSRGPGGGALLAGGSARGAGSQARGAQVRPERAEQESGQKYQGCAAWGVQLQAGRGCILLVRQRKTSEAFRLSPDMIQTVPLKLHLLTT